MILYAMTASYQEFGGLPTNRCSRHFFHCNGWKVLPVNARVFSSRKLLFILLGPVGLDWNNLKDTLNPGFDWEAAVQSILKTRDSLEDVRYIFTYYLVT